MKDYNRIEELLERYYNAQTSEAEERRLKDFFLNEEVPPHLQAEKELLLQLQTTATPKGMEKRLGKLIDQWETEERYTIKKHRPIHLQWISIAASLLLLFGTGWYLIDSQPSPYRQDTCATPEEAYAQAEKALIMFSTALNKGIGSMEEIQETAQKAETNFYKHLSKLNRTE